MGILLAESLKSPDLTVVPVQVRPRAPLIPFKINNLQIKNTPTQDNLA